MAADVTLIIEAVDKTQGVFNGISLSAAAVLGFASKTAVDFDTAISSASRALDLSSKEVADFGKQARDIAPALGLAPAKFAELSAEAGKLGVSKDNIIGFAKNIAELGLITDSTDEQIVGLASSFAALQTITGASNEDLSKAGALFNALDDKIGSNVIDITEFTRQTAATGKLLKLSIGDLGAYGSAFGALGVKNATAYRSFNSLLTKLAAPQVLGKSGLTGLATLGIQADDLAKRMTTDAKGGIDFFLGRIRDLAKTDVSAALGATKQIIGADFGDEILTLALASDKYHEALALVGNDSANAAKKQDELAKKAASVKGQMAIASANAQKLGIILGAALIPSINGVIQSLLPGAEAFGKFAEANPAIVQIGAVFLGLVATIAPVTAGIKQVANTILAIRALTTFFSGLSLAASGATLLGFAPFILGAAAIAGVAYLIIKNWEPVKNFFKNITDYILGGASDAPLSTRLLGRYLYFANPIEDDLIALRGKVTEILNSIGSAIATGVTSIISFLTPVFQLGSIPFLLLGNVALFVVNLVVGAFVGLAGLLAPPLSAAANVVGGFLGLVVSGAVDTATRLYGVVSQIVGFIGSSLASFAQTAFGLALGIGNAIATGIYNALLPVYNFVGDFLGSIYNAIAGFVGSLGSYLYNAGVSIINQLTAGIAASFNYLLQSFNNQLTQLRAYLPSSDAKQGALSDLSASGSKLWETFGAGLQSGLPSATGAIASGTSQLLPVLSGSTANSGGSSQNVTINFSPSVSGATTSDLVEALRAESRRLIDMLKVETENLNRGRLS